MAGYIGQINVNGVDYKIGSTLFAVIDTNVSGSTTTDTANKTLIFNVPLNDFVLATGVTIHIQFKRTWSGSEGIDIIQLKVGGADPKTIKNPNGATIWQENSVVSFTYDGENYIMNTVGFDANSITIDATQLNIPGFGNITKEGKITGHSNSLVVTSSDASITGGAQFGDAADGTYLDKTGTWSTPDKGVASITIQTTGPLTGGNATPVTSTGTYTIGLDNAAAHYVLAGPGSGDAAQPTFRALITDDIPNTIARIDSPTFTGTPKSVTPSANSDSTMIATKEYVDNSFAANDAMIFKGIIGTNGITFPPTDYKIGWTYRVVTPGTYAQHKCEAGDLLIAIKDYDSETASNADWTVAQANIDGYLTMANSSLNNGQLLIANGSTGSVSSAGYTIAAPSAGALLVGGTDAYTILAAGNNNKVLTMVGGVPDWADAQHFITHLYVNGTAAGKTDNESVASGTTYIHLYDDSNKRNTIQLIGSGGTAITASNAGAITIKSNEYTSAGTKNALTALSLSYNNGTEQVEQLSANTAAQMGYVGSGILYIKSIKYNAEGFSTGVIVDEQNN